MHHLKRTAIISREGKKPQSHRWKTNVRARVLGGAWRQQEQQAEFQGAASNIPVNIHVWMDSNMIESMCVVSEDEQSVLRAGQGCDPMSPMSQPSLDTATPAGTICIFSPFSPQKALGCVQHALQTNFSPRVFQKKKKKIAFLCSSQPYSLLQIQYFDNTERAEQQIGQEMKLILKSLFLKRYPLGNSLCSPRT